MALDWNSAASQGGTAAQGVGVTVPFSAQADGYVPKPRKLNWFERIVSVLRVPDSGVLRQPPSIEGGQPFHVERMKAPVDPNVN